MGRILVLCVAGVLLPNCGRVDFEYFDSTYSWQRPGCVSRIKVSVGPGLATEAVEAFPVAVSISDEPALEKARDVRFVGLDGIELASDVELLQRDDGRLVAWVTAPRLEPDTTTEFHAYFDCGEEPAGDRSREVWASRYDLVLHGTVEGGTVRDSAGARQGQVIGGVSNQPAQVGYGLQFAGGASEVKFADTESLLNEWDAFTISFWLQVEADSDDDWEAGVYEPKVFEKTGAFHPARVFRDVAGEERFQADAYFAMFGVTYNPLAVENHSPRHLALRYDGDRFTGYEDGALAFTAEIPQDRLATSDAIFTLGDSSSGLDGWLDEFRVSSTALPESWIAADARLQRKVSNFVAIGVAETAR